MGMTLSPEDFRAHRSAPKHYFLLEDDVVIDSFTDQYFLNVALRRFSERNPDKTYTWTFEVATEVMEYRS